MHKQYRTDLLTSFWHTHFNTISHCKLRYYVVLNIYSLSAVLCVGHSVFSCGIDGWIQQSHITANLKLCLPSQCLSPAPPLWVLCLVSDPPSHIPFSSTFHLQLFTSFFCQLASSFSHSASPLHAFPSSPPTPSPLSTPLPHLFPSVSPSLQFFLHCSSTASVSTISRNRLSGMCVCLH